MEDEDTVWVVETRRGRAGAFQTFVERPATEVPDGVPSFPSKHALRVWYQQFQRREDDDPPVWAPQDVKDSAKQQRQARRRSRARRQRARW